MTAAWLRVSCRSQPLENSRSASSTSLAHAIPAWAGRSTAIGFGSASHAVRLDVARTRDVVYTARASEHPHPRVGLVVSTRCDRERFDFFVISWTPRRVESETAP